MGQEVACISGSPERAPQNLHHESVSAGMCPAQALRPIGGQGPISINVRDSQGIMGESWDHRKPWKQGLMELEQSSETHVTEPLTSRGEDGGPERRRDG